MNEQAPIPQTEHAFVLAEGLWAIYRKLKRKLREQGEQSNLKPSHASVLLRLQKDGSATVSSLARAEGMRPQSMSAIIASLLEAGLVSGAPDPHDGRQTLMALSPEGERLLSDERAATKDWLTTIIQKKLSAEEQETLASAINLLSRLIED